MGIIYREDAKDAKKLCNRQIGKGALLVTV